MRPRARDATAPTAAATAAPRKTYSTCTTAASSRAWLSVWSGSAVVVLTGGEGSRDASSLPGRLGWTLRPAGLGLVLQLDQACCLNGTVALRVQPGFGRTTFTLVPPSGWVGQWPTAFLGGLGKPDGPGDGGAGVGALGDGRQIEDRDFHPRQIGAAPAGCQSGRAATPPALRPGRPGL